MRTLKYLPLVMTGALSFIFAYSTAHAGFSASPSPCAAIHVEIQGETVLNTTAEISCLAEESEGVMETVEYGCETRNPQMIEAATDAVIGEKRIRLEWDEAEEGTQKCTSLKVISDKHVDHVM